LLRGAYDEAVQWWTNVEAAARSKWGLDEPLRQTVLAALSTDPAGRPATARAFAERIRAAV